VRYSAEWDVANSSRAWRSIDVLKLLLVEHNNLKELGLGWMDLHLHYVIVGLGRKGRRLDYGVSRKEAS
jgi:hypothetical protein